MIAPARLAAYEVLRAVNSGRSDLPSALARVRGRLADERDRALAGEIAAGTLRWQGAFDALIAAFAGFVSHFVDIAGAITFLLQRIELTVPAKEQIAEPGVRTHHRIAVLFSHAQGCIRGFL